LPLVGTIGSDGRGALIDFLHLFEVKADEACSLLALLRWPLVSGFPEPVGCCQTARGEMRGKAVLGEVEKHESYGFD
jgi:hypothetical protein